MVIMRRDVPEKVGHPVEMNVQECDIDQLQKRGWYVASNSKPVTPTPEPTVETPEKEKTESDKTETEQDVRSEPTVENKTRRSPKRHEV